MTNQHKLCTCIPHASLIHWPPNHLMMQCYWVWQTGFPEIFSIKDSSCEIIMLYGTHHVTNQKCMWEWLDHEAMQRTYTFTFTFFAAILLYVIATCLRNEILCHAHYKKSWAHMDYIAVWFLTTFSMNHILRKSIIING